MKIVCFGDSNTYGFDPRSYFGSRLAEEVLWVNILGDRLGCTVINAGENGMEVPHRELEVTEFFRLLAQEQPVDFVIVMLGNNDLLQRRSVSTVVARMETFLKRIPLSPERILLAAPPILQPGAWVTDQELIAASKELNSAYRRLSDDLSVMFADAGEWNLPLAFDGVHLTEEGHRILGENLSRFFRTGG